VPMADLNGSITYNGTQLNAVTETNTAGQTVIAGCKVHYFDPSAVEIRQFTEPLALVDGIDTGGAWLGARHITIKGTVYDSTRQLTAARIDALETLFKLASGTMSFFDLVFATMAGSTKTISCRSDGLRYASDASKHGGLDAQPMAIEWAVNLYAKNPTF